ncbi:MAG: hypothetical protein U9N72_06520 [Bacteroidota bacterium]|nr:hypothetical protein [Bacteroidota bacterium]
MNFLKWYRNKIESSELDPPVGTWDNIQDQLDIDNSWELIDSYLNRRTRFIARLRISVAASLLVLTMAGAGWIYFSTVGTVKQQGTAEIIPAEGSEKFIQQKNVPATITVDENPVIKISLAGLDNELKEVTLDKTNLKDYQSERQTGNIEKLSVDDPYITDQQYIDYTNITFGPDLVNYGKQKKERKTFRKFYVGTRGQLANTWLVNQKTISGFKSTSLVSTNATFGSNFGFYAGTNLLNRLDLQMDFNILAQNNQDYNEYLNGHYVTNKLKLDYSQLALSFRYYIMSNKFLEGEHGINFGAYMAYLHNAYQNIDGETFYLSDNYNSMDYGLLLGYEYIFPLHGQLGLGTGFRAYYGLSNIYAGDENIPYYLNETNNASLNFTLSLKYILK